MASRYREKHIAAVEHAFGPGATHKTFDPEKSKGFHFFQLSHAYRFVVDDLQPAEARTLFVLMARADNVYGYLKTSYDELVHLTGVKKRPQIKAQLAALAAKDLILFEERVGRVELLILDPMYALRLRQHSLDAGKLAAINHWLREMKLDLLSAKPAESTDTN